MRNLRVGKVAITPKGEWKDGVSYEMLDAVYYNGDSYISVSDRNKSNPTDDSSWKILAKGSMDGVKVVNREWFGVFDNKNNFFTIDDDGSVTYASYAANPSEITIKNPIRIEFDGGNYQTRVYICKRDEVQGGGQPIEIDTLSTRNGKYVFEFTPNDEERKYILIGIICSGVVNVKVSELFIMTSEYIYNGINSKVDKTDITQSTGTSETAVMSQKAVSDALSNVYTKAESDARYLRGGFEYCGLMEWDGKNEVKIYEMKFDSPKREVFIYGLCTWDKGNRGQFKIIITNEKYPSGPYGISYFSSTSYAEECFHIHNVCGNYVCDIISTNNHILPNELKRCYMRNLLTDKNHEDVGLITNLKIEITTDLVRIDGVQKWYVFAKN